MFLSAQASHHGHLYHREKTLFQTLSLDLRPGSVSLPQDEPYHAWMPLSSLALPVRHALSLM
jgi:hypothetical protein